MLLQHLKKLTSHHRVQFSDYTSEQNIDDEGTSFDRRPSNRNQNEDLVSNSGTSTSVPRSIEVNLARDRIGSLSRNGGGGGGGGGGGSGHYTTGPLIPCEPPSPAPSRRTERSTMNRAPSVADISQYECNEDGAIRLHMISNMILLIASLIMIGTGKNILVSRVR